jgi:hypothetical protein
MLDGIGMRKYLQDDLVVDYSFQAAACFFDRL